MIEPPRIGASVDVGSHSAHLLVGEVDGGLVLPRYDESARLELGLIVDRGAHLGPIARRALVETMTRFATIARENGATQITFMGTEPIRRAADAARAVHEVEESSGAPLLVLTHREEALLTLVAVTGGRSVESEILVIDIGGGSSESCVIDGGGDLRTSGLPIGSDRLTARHVSSDPATAEEIEAMRTDADRVMRDALEARPAEVVIVGGAASNLLKVTAGGPADAIITHDRLAEALANVTMMPAAMTAERYVLNPVRARILPAGAVIVGALMRRYGVDQVRVSEAGMRDGAILVADHDPYGWRDRLGELALGWRD